MRIQLSALLLSLALVPGCNLSDPAPYDAALRPGSTAAPMKDMSAPGLDLGMERDLGKDLGSGLDMQGGQDAQMPPDGMCGNGMTDALETCDADCPQDPALDCGPAPACEEMVIVGSASACDAECVAKPVTTCTSGDGCCPSVCSFPEDRDCVQDRKVSGLPCDEGRDCGADGVCVGDSPGFCSAACTSTAECDPDELCIMDRSGAQKCAVPCEGAADCSTERVCVQDDEVFGQQICLEPSVVPNTIGEPCTSGSECADGEQCLTQASNASYKGGYCTALCDPEACPAEAVCHAINPEQPAATSFCYAACAQASDCRDDYSCKTVAEGSICLP